MIIKLIFLTLMGTSIFFIFLQVLNIFYIHEDLFMAIQDIPYWNWNLYFKDSVTLSMFTLAVIIVFLLISVALGDGFSFRKSKSKYDKENYAKFLSRHSAKRGLVRVCYNFKGEVTRFRLECLWDVIWYPIAWIQNRVASYYLWPATKRWNKMKKWKTFDGEIKHTAGIPIMANRSRYFLGGRYNKVYYLPSDSHTFFVGSTGRGKSVSFMLPMMVSSIQAGESMIVHDTKKELCAATYDMLKKNGYKIIILDFNTPLEGDCWSLIKLAWDLWCEILEKEKLKNPNATFRECNMSKPIEIISDLALNLCYEADAKQPMWWQGASDMLAGGLILLFEEGIKENINILSVKSLFEDQEILKRYLKKNRKPTDQSWIKLVGYLAIKDVTLSSMNGVFNNKIRSLVMNQDIINMTSNSNAIDMRDMFKQKTAVFLMTQSSKSTFYPLVTAFVTQFYEVAVMVAEMSPGRTLENKFKVYLDEFPVLPPFKEIVNMYAVSRGFGITLIAFIQSIAQMVTKYGPDVTKVFTDNNANTIFLGAASDETKEEFVKAAGKELYYNKKTKQFEERDLITKEKLRLFEKGRSLLIRNEWHPYIIKLPPYDMYVFSSDKRTWDFERRATFEEIQVINLKDLLKGQLDQNMSSVGAKKFKGKSVDLSALQ